MRNRPADSPRLENLENRTLFSTLNVADYGAVPNDGRDDAGAIDAAIRAARKGDVVQFDKGQYDVSRTIDAGDGLTITGVRGATLVRSADRAFAFNLSGGRSATFTNLNFDGSGIGAAGKSALDVDWCDFTNFARGVDVGFGAGTALGGHGSGWDPQDSHITNSSFHDSPGGWGIGFFKGSGLTIADNEFVNILNGIKSNNGGDTAHDITITRNYFSGIRRMFAELQGQVKNFELSDNYVENPVLSSNFNDNIHSLGFSVIYHGDETRNARILRNTIKCPQRPDGTGVRLAFELGNNFTVEDNYIDGIGTMTSVFMGDSSGPRSADQIGHTVVRNNKMVNARWGQGGSYGQYGGNASYGNNNASVQLSWDTNRHKPGPGRAGGGKSNVDKPNEQGRASDDSQTSADVDDFGAIYVTDLEPMRATSGWGPVEKDHSNGGKGEGDGQVMAIDNKLYKRGLGVAINSEVVYKLDGKYSTFFSDVGIDDAAHHKGSMTFVVYGDGKKLFDSGLMTGNDAAKKVQVDVNDVRVLKLVTTSAGDGGNSDLGDWAGARLT